MTDYCGCRRNGKAKSEEKRTARLVFEREQLLYDIRNYAYVEADVMDDDNQHAQHVLADIGEEGNVDRVNRILALVHAEVTEILYPYTKVEPEDEDVVDFLWTPDAYMIELQIPLSMSRTTVHLLSRLIHEYMVYKVLADWLSITKPDAATNWIAKAEAIKDEIDKAKNQRGVFTRTTHPW